MIIYSITFVLEESIELEWLSFMKQQYIAPIMQYNLFLDYRFSKTHPQEGMDQAYNIQLRCKSLTELAYFEKNVAPKTHDILNEKYKGKFASFVTILEEIE